MKLLLLCVFSVLSLVEPRRYDIEVECFKLYGEDLNSVLLKFRKSPEYLSILDDKVNAMKAQWQQLLHQIISYYRRLLSQKVQESFLVKVDGRIRNHRRDIGSLFKLGYYHDPSQSLRQGSGTHHGHPLDHYIKERQALSTEKINSYKDLGFEYAGYAIHSVIKHMGPDDTPGQSTKLPYGGEKDNDKTTTEHREHSVYPTEVSAPVTNLEEQPAPDTYRYSSRNKSV